MPISGGHVNYLVAAHAQRKPLRIRGGILFNDRLAASPAMALVSFYRNFTNKSDIKIIRKFYVVAFPLVIQTIPANAVINRAVVKPQRLQRRA